MSDIDHLRPETIEGIKRLGSRLKLRFQLPHSQALDNASRRGGFKNYAHARNAIESSNTQDLRHAKHCREVDRKREAFRAKSRGEWSAKINQVAGTAASAVWTDVDDIIGAIEPFMGESKNHGFYPTGGGNDFNAVQTSTEAGCIELMVGSRAYIVRPRRLRLERISQALSESFLYLELGSLAPSGVYPEKDEEDEPLSRRRRETEELVDMGNGCYLDREVWSRGFVDHEDDPLPDHARLISRLLRGNIMFACKASIWNDISETYQGWHDHMGADEVRRQIEKILSKHGPPE